jgi:hypothetical protein
MPAAAIGESQGVWGEILQTVFGAAIPSLGASSVVKAMPYGVVNRTLALTTAD